MNIIISYEEHEKAKIRCFIMRERERNRERRERREEGEREKVERGRGYIVVLKTC